MLVINLIQEYYLIFKNKIVGLYTKIPRQYSHGNKGDVIVLVGLNETWNFLKTVSEYINKKGYKIHFPQFSTRSSLHHCTQDVLNYIVKHNLSDVILVTHSKGGLIARSIIKDQPENIKYAIEISSPNKGTIFGYLNIISLSELKPNCKKLQVLEDIDTKKIINIYPKLDNHVIPNSSLYLEGAKNIKLDIVGHTRILESKELLNEIDKIL